MQKHRCANKERNEMQNEYQLSTGLLKAIKAMATAAAGALITWFPTYLQTEGNKEYLVGAVALLIIGIVSWARNFVKIKYPDSALGKLLMLLCVLMACGLCLPACAMNRAHFSETTEDGVSTKFEQLSLVTIGSKQQSGVGDMDYQATSETQWRLKVGNAASGQEAYNPTELLIKGLELGMGIIAPKAQTSTVTPAAPLEIGDGTAPELTLTGP